MVLLFKLIHRFVCKLNRALDCPFFSYCIVICKQFLVYWHTKKIVIYENVLKLLKYFLSIIDLFIQIFQSIDNEFKQHIKIHEYINKDLWNLESKIQDYFLMWGSRRNRRINWEIILSCLPWLCVFFLFGLVWDWF